MNTTPTPSTRLSAVVAAVIMIGSATQALAGTGAPPSGIGADGCEVTSGYLYVNGCNAPLYPSGRSIQVMNGRAPVDSAFIVTGNATAYASLYCKDGWDRQTAVYRGAISSDQTYSCGLSYASVSYCGPKEACQWK